MLALIRIILIPLIIVFISIGASIFSILRPFHRNNVYHAARYLGKVSRLFGLTIEVRIPESVKNIGPVVYVANHQSNFDLFTMGAAVQPNTVSVGKKSLKWIPFFGFMYWVTGNILIDRANKSKAMGTINQTADKIKSKGLSVWLFPEGTRSKGRGLLRFKTGAFRTAVQANVPIVPVCSSNSYKVIKLNRWDNGKLIIEFLPPVYLSDAEKQDIKKLTNNVHDLMAEKINQLSREAGTDVVLSK